MRNIILFILVLACLPVSTVNSTTTDRPKTLNQIMSAIGKEMVDLYPLIMIRRRVTNIEYIKMEKSVAKLQKLFKTASPFIKTKSETYQFSYDYMLDYLRDTKQAFEKKKYQYANSKLSSLGAVCTSCHTQDSKLRTLFPGTSRTKFQDDYSFANFCFMTRHYAEAIEYYDKYLIADKFKSDLDIIRPLQRIITIYSQVLNKPGDGAKQLRRYQGLKSHSRSTKEHLTKWIQGLEELQASGAGKVKNIDFDTLEKYVKESFGDLNATLPGIISTPKQEISRVWLRGQLYKYLNTSHDKNEIPKIIYWLALSDRAIDYNYYFSLSDLYLQQCIIKHPEHPYAKRCFNEYSEYVKFSYSGSAGTFVPADIHQKLDYLKRLIK